MEINAKTRLAAVVANPIKHSLSPFIHNLAFEMTGENGLYLAWEIEEAGLEQIVKNIRLLDMYGINLSMPYKQAVLPYLDELSPSAEAIGAVNTVVRQGDKLVGHNTDGIGFFRSLEALDYRPEGQELVVLGGGGAGMAMIAQALLDGAQAVHVFARKSHSFAGLEERLNAMSDKVKLYDLADEAELQAKLDRSSLLVNATSVGMDGLSMPCSEAIKLSPELLVADAIYKVAETPFLTWAKQQGCRTTNGLGMLLYQAAEAFELWTGKEMPVEAVESALLRKMTEDK
ncbi:shikimate dehydrogenase [Lactococcus termiticola]|uniref:Shikimate dehydrogenase (NADP(+)) n=1 Tax=Lactococcus termiticola TaxID=2169526 RepID=A0A2R5HEQ3_9LACT|nr:shikimate dehydrogenase [Lactococcus termiticola]GBG96296.1 shikimate 5-dehydrogenase [Lactococcus termiticola]